jgi:hypothetical protein
MWDIAKWKFMTKLLCITFVLAPLFFLSIAKSAGGGYISFTPGPDFTTRVNTAWGNYIVDVEPDGGAAWVGTEDEYVNRKAQAILHMQGYIVMHVDGARPNEHHMISTRLPSVSLGATTLAEIQGSINFDKHVAFNPAFHAPRERNGYQYAFIAWTPSGGSGFHATLRDAKSSETFEPFNCDGEACRYQIPESKLGVPLVIIFTKPNTKPAALPISSLAHLQYQAEVTLGGPGASIDKKLLESLHSIDSSVPVFSRK